MFNITRCACKIILEDVDYELEFSGDKLESTFVPSFILKIEGGYVWKIINNELK